MPTIYKDEESLTLYQNDKEIDVSIQSFPPKLEESEDNILKGEDVSWTMSNIPPKIIEFSGIDVLLFLVSEDNPYLVTILKDSLKEIQGLLNERNIKGSIKLTLERDPEEEKARWITIVIKVNNDSLTDRIQLWKDIDELIRKQVEGHLEKTEIESDKERLKKSSILVSSSVTN